MSKVLIVDDSALMRRRISQILSARGCEVESARNGADALGTVETFAPDVITLDINMPEMGGLTFLGHLMRRKNAGLPESRMVPQREPERQVHAGSEGRRCAARAKRYSARKQQRNLGRIWHSADDSSSPVSAQRG